MHNQVFIVNTQFHLLIAQSIIEDQHLSNCYLISYAKDKLINSILFDSSLWEQVHILPSVKKSKVYMFRREISYLNYLESATLFWGNDYQIENQLVISIIKPNRILLFDDGIASYMKNIRKVSPYKRLAMQLFSYVFLRGALKNVEGVGNYHFDERYCLSRELISKNMQAKEVHLSFSKAVTDEVNAVFGEKIITKPAGLLLTQPITEYNVMTVEEEDAHLASLVNEANHQGITTLVVKYHPAENKQRCEERLNIIKKYSASKVLVLPRLNNLPIEVITCDKDNKQFEFLLSVYSTGLLTLKLLQDELCCISSITNSDAQKSEAFSQLYKMFKKFNIQEVNDERDL
ncbi:MAG: glycosyltransferase family 52 [Pseudoalteromonas sp.]|uniref:glycosyltransferase family 52 n=1 Tax=Pseudoalteromonas sp. TaxID=53249 RepID=UPI003F958181